jgi:hypothetical protein
MNRWNRTIAVAALLSAFSAPALAADPSPTCTVCNDPTWPSLQSLAPGIGLNAPAIAQDPSAIPGDATWLVASNRSPGVGVSVRAGTTGSVYSDPTWPTNAVATDGMAPSVPVAAPKAAAPAVRVAAR